MSKRNADISTEERERLVSELTTALKSDEAKQHLRYERRLRALLQYLKGAPIESLLSPGVGRSALFNWLYKLKTNGVSALKDKPHLGAKPKLNQQQLEQLANAIKDEPNRFGYDVWNGKIVADFIHKQFDVTLSVSHCLKILKDKLNLSFTRARMFPTKGKDNVAEQEEFKKKIREKVQQERILIAQDEAHFKQMSSIAYAWSPRGETKVIASSPSQKSYSVSGYAFLNQGILAVQEVEHFTYETVIASFRELLDKYPAPLGEQYVMIIDNAPWHRKAIRLIQEDDQYQDIRKAIEFVPLPPYCPHLNPIEQCWRLTRYEATHNRYFPKFEDLKSRLTAYFGRFTSPTKQLRTLLQFNWMGFCV